jgi:replicative DNA helicase
MADPEYPPNVSELPFPGDGELARIKMQPHSVEAEQSVLGGLLLSADGWDAVAETVTASDFYRPDHRLIYRQIAQLAEALEPIDVITVADKLEASGELESAGGLPYLAELAQNTPSASNIRAYAQVVSERASLRKLIEAAQDIAESGFTPEGRTSDELIDEAERRIMQISEQGPKSGAPRDVNPLLQKALDRIEELFNTGGDITGLSTGFADLDRMTSGLQPSDLVIVAGRPSMGKTSFAMNMVEHAVLAQDKPILVFSMEMPADSLIIRMLSSIGRIDQTRIRNGKLEQEDWPKLSRGEQAQGRAPVYRRHPGPDPDGSAQPRPAGAPGERRPGHDHGGLHAVDAGGGIIRGAYGGDLRDLPQPQGHCQGIRRAHGGPVPAQPLPGAAAQQAAGEFGPSRVCHRRYPGAAPGAARGRQASTNPRAGGWGAGTL